MERQQAPKLFVNGTAQSGLHLAGPLAAGLLRMGTPRWLDPWQDDLHAVFGQMSPGDICCGHVPYRPELKRQLDERRIRRLFIFRDPRDMIVSLAQYMTDPHNAHPHGRYFAEHVKDDGKRLMMLIAGFYETREIAERYGHASLGYGDIVSHYMPYLKWMEDDGTHAVRYEELACGTARSRECIAKAIEYVLEGTALSKHAMEQLAESAMSSIAPLRLPDGTADGPGLWKRHFGEAHKLAFKELAGDLLIYLGYEKDLLW